MGVLGKLLNIYPKLIVSFLLVLTPVYVISLMMNNYGASNVRAKIEDAMKSRVGFYIRQLEGDFSLITRTQEEFVNYRDVRMLSSKGEVYSDNDWRNAVLNVRSRLISLSNSSNYVRSASVYLPSVNRLISSANTYDLLPDEEYKALKGVSQRLADPFVYWNNRLYISFPYSNLALINGREPSFLVSAEIATEKVGEMLDSLMIDESGGTMVVGRDGRWVLTGKKGNTELEREMLTYVQQNIDPSAPAQETVKKDIHVKTVQFGGQSYWVYAEDSRDMGFSLLMYTPESEMLGSLKQYRVWFWVLSFISLLVIILFSYWIFLQIHQPLLRLIRAFRGMENGKNEALVYKRSDEFGYLYQQYNQTTNRIQELIHEVYEQNYRANLSELRQLQSQINPHFLYNNFYILYRLARNGENEKIAEFTSFLGKYFKFITRTHKGTIRLEEETAFSRLYVDIQTFRFEERIEARFEELPPAYADAMVPKLILQPILENVYQHGMRNTLEGGLLEVRFDPQEEGLDIIVEDNGEPMPDVEYEDLQLKLQATGWLDVETTGLVNVHRRLRLEFGNRGGVTFSRKSGGGNQVVISIPNVREKRAED
ncbi:sensor histidine kinase [Paenibacillus nasutitermitis]|uniref:Two-component sensor kinase n=1 Tax=Paenibacillus nasutitermitis TaxID=1652958 RepID=A0A916YWE5_9BACL|nr:histidine kinase [Paenibacillus nasutitermitis]GGD64428.1 putative two-component sensor kinase [Paenibacillus nasutitermitis]